MSKDPPKSIIFFDLEATGLRTKTDQIIQIAAKCGDKEFDTYVNCTKTISPLITDITGITRKTVQKAPLIKDALIQFNTWLSEMPKPSVLVAQNGSRYDFKLLFSEMIHNRISVNELAVDHLFDSLIWCRHHYKPHEMLMSKHGNPSYKLGNIYKAVTGEELDGAHDAMIDVRGTAVICKPCEDYYGIGYVDKIKAIEEHKRDLYGLQITVSANVKRKLGKTKSIADFIKKSKS